MYLYIDKPNVDALIGARKNQLYNDCIKTIKKQLNVFFNFSKKELKGNEPLLAWFQLLVDGVGDANKFIFLDENVFPKRPFEEGCMLQFNENKLSAIYLVCDDNIKHLKEIGAVLIGEPGEEINVFNRLFLLQNDYDFHKEVKIGSIELSKWNDLERYSMPLTDIIFVDSYIITDASLIASNLIRYIEVLCSNARNKVNIVLYVNSKNIALSFALLAQQLKVAIRAVTGHVPNFTLIEYSTQRGVDHLGEHDRTIFTNYLRIKSGDSYNYFKSTGEVCTTGREITYNSLGKKQTHDLAKTLISDLQVKIDFLKANNNGIQGDRVSNYLNLK